MGDPHRAAGRRRMRPRAVPLAVPLVLLAASLSWSAAASAASTVPRSAARCAAPATHVHHLRVPPGCTFQTGYASWYGEAHDGLPTASGERFNMNGLTAAHATLPMNARVRVISVITGRSVVVRINDRLPTLGGRIIDLSAKAASVLGIKGRGVAKVRVVLLGGETA